MNQIWYVVYVEPQVAVFIKYGVGARCKSKTVRRHNQDRSRRATNHRVTYSDATGLNYPCYRSWWPFHNVPECSNTSFLEINDGQPPCFKKSQVRRPYIMHRRRYFSQIWYADKWGHFRPRRTRISLLLFVLPVKCSMAATAVLSLRYKSQIFSVT